MCRQHIVALALTLSVVLPGCVDNPNMHRTQDAATRTGTSSPQSATAVQPPAAPPATVAAIAPARLIGLSRTDVVRHLGQPVFQRQDRPALLLRYREGRCILDLFLYPHSRDGLGDRVEYIEARAADGRRIEARPCIEAVVKARRAGRAG